MAKLLTKDLIEEFLKVDHHKKSLIEIKNIEFEPLAKGENYITEAYRVKLVYARYDGNSTTEYYFVKLAPSTPSKRKFVDDLGLIDKEIKVYADLLPLMQQLLLDIGDHTELLWPKCIGVKRYDIILMKDLVSRGYYKCDKRSGLDLEHSIIVLKALAKFHAISVVLIDKMLLDHRTFQSFGFSEENEDVSRMIESRLTIFVEIMKNWGKEWQNLRESIKENLEKGHKMMKKCCKFNENNFNVINHGDLWTSNILFKRCNFTNNLCGVKFVDFQETHYNSFAIDIQYFMFSSVNTTVRDNHYTEMMKSYYQSLLDSFKSFKHEPNNLPTFNDVLIEIDNKRIFGLITSLYLLHLMQATPEQAIDIEDWMHGNQADSITYSEYYSEKAKQLLKPFINVDFNEFL